MSNNVASFPQLADWINEYCKTHSDPFVRDSSKMIQYCFELDLQFPEKYGWRFTDIDAYKRQVEAAKHQPNESNKMYWTDQARNIEAYSMMTFWRGVELLKPAIRSLNLHEVIAPAVLARSLMELSSSFLINANYFDKCFQELQFPEETVVIADESFEENIIKMIWGTRLGDPPSYLHQTNAITFVQKVSKNPHLKDAYPTYEFLCEIAHPNVVGNTRFWSHVEKVYPDGSEQRIIARYADGQHTKEILNKILWSLGWSAMILRNGFEITREALRLLLEKLGK